MDIQNTFTNKTKLGMISLVLVSDMGLKGCATNPYSGEQEISKAGIGAIIGGVAGAIVDKDKRGRGLLIGAAAGGGIGYYFDQQAEQLRKELANTGVSVSQDPETKEITLNMPGNLTFSSGSSDIQSNFYPVLNSVAKVLDKYDNTKVIIAGHTDSKGSEAYNQTLSEERAASVSAYLNSQGVEASRLQAIGYGETQPISNNDTPEGRSTNRRVTVDIEALPEKQQRYFGFD